MIESEIEYEALNSTLLSDGWAIYKRIVQEEIGKHFRSAKSADNKDVAYVSLQKYKAVEDILQKPYHLLKESEFKKEGDNQ